MDKRLIQAGYIAIPLTHNPTHLLNPQPNFLIIENLFGRTETELPAPVGLTVCQTAYYKLVFREILPEDLGRTEQMRELVFESENQAVPVTLVPALSSYPAMQQYQANINQMLALFQYRGILANFQLTIDSAALTQILAEP